MAFRETFRSAHTLPAFLILRVHRHHLHQHHLGWCLCCISYFAIIFFTTIIIVWRWMLISALNISVLLIDYFLLYFWNYSSYSPRFMLKAVSPRICQRGGSGWIPDGESSTRSAFLFIPLSVSSHQYRVLIFHASPKLYDLSNSQRGWIEHSFSSSITIWISNFVVLHQLHWSCPKVCFIFTIVVIYIYIYILFSLD